MGGGNSPYSGSTKIKLIASVVAEKNMFFDLHLYEHLKLGRLLNNSVVFMNREVEKYKLVLLISRCELLMVSILSLSYLWWSHLKVFRYKSWLIFCFEWINYLSTDQILYHHNFATTQAIFKQKRITWSPECVGC